MRIYYYTKDGKNYGSHNQDKINHMYQREKDRHNRCTLGECELWEFYYNPNNELMNPDWNG